jgi:hypothetical protein
MGRMPPVAGNVRFKTIFCTDATSQPRVRTCQINAFL